jgi:hypothetical protein
MRDDSEDGTTVAREHVSSRAMEGEPIPEPVVVSVGTFVNHSLYGCKQMVLSIDRRIEADEFRAFARRRGSAAALAGHITMQDMLEAATKFLISSTKRKLSKGGQRPAMVTGVVQQNTCSDMFPGRAIAGICAEPSRSTDSEAPLDAIHEQETTFW